MLDLNTFIFVAVAALFVVCGIFAWLVDSGLRDEHKAYVKYSLFAMIAGVLGLFFLIKDDSEFEYAEYVPQEKNPGPARMKDSPGKSGGGDLILETADQGSGGSISIEDGGGGGGDGSMSIEDGGSIATEDGAKGPLTPEEAAALAEKEAAEQAAGKSDCPQCPKVVLIAAGQALIGSPTRIAMKGAQSAPASTVTVKSDFNIGKYEVTVDEFKAFVKESGYQPKGRCKNPKTGEAGDFIDPGVYQSGKSPVVCVNFADAISYADFLTQKTGHKYRLPTEIEWEYAARAGESGAYSTSGDISGGQANFKLTGKRGPVTVGSFDANSNGMHDVHGNVWEMTSDCWSPGYLSGPARARGPEVDCSKRIAKGGAWFSAAEHLNFAVRVGVSDRFANNGLGFRVVREEPVRVSGGGGKGGMLSDALSDAMPK